MPEVSIVGGLETASGFDGLNNLFVKWRLVASPENWRLTHGDDNGTTWVSERNEELEEPVLFNHPLEATYACTGLGGWPRLYVEIGSVDRFGHSDLCGYGFCHIPTTPGEHEIDIAAWRPRGSWTESISCYFLGGNPRYTQPEVVLSGAPRFDHHCVTVGRLRLRATVLVKGFAMFGVYFDCAPHAQNADGADIVPSLKPPSSRSAAANEAALAAQMSTLGRAGTAANAFTPSGSSSSSSSSSSFNASATIARATAAEHSLSLAAGVSLAEPPPPPVTTTHASNSTSSSAASNLSATFSSASFSASSSSSSSLAATSGAKPSVTFAALPGDSASQSRSSQPPQWQQPQWTVPEASALGITTASSTSASLPVSASLPSVSVPVVTAVSVPTPPAQQASVLAPHASTQPALQPNALFQPQLSTQPVQSQIAPVAASILAPANVASVRPAGAAAAMQQPVLSAASASTAVPSFRPMSALPAFGGAAGAGATAASLGLLPLPAFNAPALGGLGGSGLGGGGSLASGLGSSLGGASALRPLGPLPTGGLGGAGGAPGPMSALPPFRPLAVPIVGAPQQPSAQALYQPPMGVLMGAVAARTPPKAPRPASAKGGAGEDFEV